MSTRASLGYIVEFYSKTNHSVSHFGQRSIFPNLTTWSQVFFLAKLVLRPNLLLSQQYHPGFVALQTVQGATLV